MTGALAIHGEGKSLAKSSRPSLDLLPFEEMTTRADSMMSVGSALRNALWNARSCNPEGFNDYQISTIEWRLLDITRALEDFDKREDEIQREGWTIYDLRDAIQEFDDPSVHYDAGGVLKRKIISEHLMMLVDSFPASNAPNPEFFGAMMLEEIRAAKPSRLALEATCREIRRTMKFMPSISEVLAVLKKQATAWNGRRHVVGNIIGNKLYLADERRRLKELLEEKIARGEAGARAEAEYRRAALSGEGESIPF